MKHFFSFAYLVVAACGGGSDTPSVDAPANQRPDAHVPPPGDAPNSVCDPADPTSCSGETICIAQVCEAAFDRIYHFAGIAVTVADKNPDGSAWDPLGGAPDPHVTVKLNDTTVLTTADSTDSFSGTYTETVDQQIVAGSKLELLIDDDDSTSGDDRILDCVIDPLSADLLRDGIVGCSGTGTLAGSAVTMSITPKG
jgi:hypothetical protein